MVSFPETYNDPNLFGRYCTQSLLLLLLFFFVVFVFVFFWNLGNACC